MNYKHATIHSILLIILGLIFLGEVQAKQIEFHILGVDSAKGKLYVQLFKGEDNYQKGNSAAITVVAAKSGSNTISFPNITPGEYALRFFQDENGNGKLETNFIGIPTEGYGFSNNVKPNYGPVSYQEIKFDVSAEQELLTNTTHVIY